MAKNTTVTTENNCDVDQSLQVLSDLYKNVTMAQNAVKTLLPYVEDTELTKQLHKQVEAYDEYTEKIGTVAKNLNFDPTPAPQFALTMAGMGIRFKMATDRTNTHIAKIMLQGTLNGLIDLYRIRLAVVPTFHAWFGRRRPACRYRRRLPPPHALAPKTRHRSTVR